MNNGFRFKALRSGLSATEIAALRRVSPHSISEIQRRALSEESLLDVPVFSGGWPGSKARIVQLLQSIESGALPLAVFSVEADANSPEVEEQLTVERAHQRLQFLREISLEQDMQAQLEEGYISSPEDYKPLPENEA